MITEHEKNKEKKLKKMSKLTLWTMSRNNCHHNHFRKWIVSTIDWVAAPTYYAQLNVMTGACRSIPNATVDYDDACDGPFLRFHLNFVTDV